MADIATKLEGCTWEGLVRKDTVMQTFLRSGSCQSCGAVASEQLDHFVASTIEGISKEIAKVGVPLSHVSTTSMIKCSSRSS